MAPDESGTSDWYRRAAVELAATSDLQVAWAHGSRRRRRRSIALIDRLPREHRQPSLVFSVARWLGAPAAGWPEFREFLVEEWPRVEAAARERRTQTNEVGRCAPLLAALDRIPGPIALLEVGASAGLCLGVDATRTASTTGRSSATAIAAARCRTTGDRARRRPACPTSSGAGASTSRRSSLDRSATTTSPGSRRCCRPTARSALARLRAACATLAADPPEVVAGDALAALPAVAADRAIRRHARDRRARNPRLPAARRPRRGRCASPQASAPASSRWSRSPPSPRSRLASRR